MKRALLLIAAILGILWIAFFAVLSFFGLMVVFAYNYGEGGFFMAFVFSVVLMLPGILTAFFSIKALKSRRQGAT